MDIRVEKRAFDWDLLDKATRNSYGMRSLHILDFGERELELKMDKAFELWD